MSNVISMNTGRPLTKKELFENTVWHAWKTGNYKIGKVSFHYIFDIPGYGSVTISAIELLNIL